MSTNEELDYRGWIGRTVVDPAGERIGKVTEIYADEVTGRPEWLTVNTGVLNNRLSFVPLDDAETSNSDGDVVVVPHAKATVEGAPQVEEGAGGFLQPEAERALFEYYGRGESAARTGPSGSSKGALYDQDMDGDPRASGF